jgi:hypothetical protein
MNRARTHLRLLVPALAALVALAFAATAQADYEQVGLFAQEGNGEQLHFSTSAAVNYTGAGGEEAGSLYTTAGNRVSRYDAKGEIKEVWGWETIASGPDLPNQVNTLKVSAGSGSYELALRTARGLANFTKGSKVITDVFTEAGAFQVGDSVGGNGYLAAGTTITAVGANTLEVSLAATSSTEIGRAGLFATETTTPIPYNASAAELKEALVALPAFGPGDVSVTGGPGDAGGTTPYELTFEGEYAGTEVQLSSTESTLAGGVPSSSVAIATTTVASTPGFQRCRVDNGDVCSQQLGNPPNAEEGVGHFFGPEGVAVDESTGYVYVLNRIEFENPRREHNLIEVFSADGSEVIARFGDAGAESESFEEGPTKLHRSPEGQRIAVDGNGKVYLTDIGNQNSEYRVMCFRPESAGDYEHYAYCGRSQDIALGKLSPSELALDDSGHIYVGSLSAFQELSLADPTAEPLCTYSTHGQAYSMTTNPLTGEVFYFNANDSKIHRLKPCDPEMGKFEEAQTPVKGSPPAGEIKALTFNPNLSWGPNRPPGVLYGADAEWHRYETPDYRGLGYILAPAEVRSPEVLAESVSGTRTTSAVLQAEINPNGFATRYVFQYESEDQYEASEPGERFAGAKEAPAGGGEINGGSIGEAAAAVTGLTPDTAYRFRVIATSECNGKEGAPCTSEGEASPFATYPLFPPGLPDHRAYELVSPSQKHGGEVIPAEPGIGSCKECKPSAGGTVSAMQSSPDGEALAYEGQPFTPFEGAVNYDSYVARRTAAGWQSTALIPALPPAPAIDRQVAFDTSLDHGLLNLNGASLELQDTAEPGATTPLVNEAPPNRTGGVNEFRISYGGHSADFSRQFFAANDSLTKETPFAPEPPDPGVSKKDLYEWHEGQLSVANVLPGNATVATGAKFASTSPDTHAVSDNGIRVYFEDEAGHLYVREGGEETRQVNDAGHFLSATSEGSEVLLTDGCLYSLESESCTDLTEGRGGFKGILGQSKDLSRIYFVDSAVVAENEGAGIDSAGDPQFAEAGKDNLYSWSGGEARFVAQLATYDGSGAADGNGNYALYDWDPNPSHRSAEASPDGRFLAFGSVAPLSGYDNVGKTEAFLYNSTTGKLTCASCNPTGEAPLGNSTLRRIYPAPEEFPQPRYLTNEGRLYFDSADSLSARDTNEGVEDVYEYEPQGAGAQGACEREAGCTRLISAGTEPVDSNLIAVDETGKNVFFDTRDKLALKDKDELLDVYDAREGGGIAAESEISRAECQGENCQAPVSPPNDPTPASSSFEGSGNVKEEPAAKKHAKKKHAKKHKKKAKKHAKHSRAAKRNHGGAK